MLGKKAGKCVYGTVYFVKLHVVLVCDPPAGFCCVLLPEVMAKYFVIFICSVQVRALVTDNSFLL